MARHNLCFYFSLVDINSLDLIIHLYQFTDLIVYLEITYRLQYIIIGRVDRGIR